MPRSNALTYQVRYRHHTVCGASLSTVESIVSFETLRARFWFAMKSGRTSWLCRGSLGCD